MKRLTEGEHLTSDDLIGANAAYSWHTLFQRTVYRYEVPNMLTTCWEQMVKLGNCPDEHMWFL